MVVVVLVGILTVMAVPTMAEGRYNARTFDNAAQIAELFREARTRAVGRGGAMLVTMSATGSYAGSDLGTFTLYEGQVPSTAGVAAALPLPGGSPLSSCASPAASQNIWSIVITNAATTLMDQVNLNNAGEQQAQIWTSINDNSGKTVQAASLCFTPLGRAYYMASSASPVFTAGVGMLHGSLQISVQRSGVGGAATGLKRTVIIPDSGSTRIVSQ